MRCSIPDFVHSSADMPFENELFIDALVSTKKMIIMTMNEKKGDTRFVGGMDEGVDCPASVDAD